MDVKFEAGKNLLLELGIKTASLMDRLKIQAKLNNLYEMFEESDKDELEDLETENLFLEILKTNNEGKQVNVVIEEVAPPVVEEEEDDEEEIPLEEELKDRDSEEDEFLTPKGEGVKVVEESNGEEHATTPGKRGRPKGSKNKPKEESSPVGEGTEKVERKKGIRNAAGEPSNKEIVYKYWKENNGNVDPKKCVELVEGRVQLSTVRGWLWLWKNNQALPACVNRENKAAAKAAAE